MNKDKAIKIALDALHLWHWTGETKNLMRAHDVLRNIVVNQPLYQSDGTESCVDCQTSMSCFTKGKDFDICSYYEPPQKKWVGLTEDERDTILRSESSIFEMTEAILKAKNEQI
jgi:hypothetical protein